MKTYGLLDTILAGLFILFALLMMSVIFLTIVIYPAVQIVAWAFTHIL